MEKLAQQKELVCQRTTQLYHTTHPRAVAQFGFLAARPTCPGLPWMTKVPRRGTASLAVGETHGLEQNCLSTPKESVWQLGYQVA
jgi:hypothetical protein